MITLRCRNFLIVLGMLVLLASAIGAEAKSLVGRVVGVADGDTLSILDAKYIRHNIRLSGIDAPEKGQAFGNRSKQHLSSLVFHKFVRVEWKKRDRNGRIVGKVLVHSSECDGCEPNLDVGRAQLRSGLAWWHRKYAGDQSAPDQTLYESDESEAKLKGVGLWGDAAHVPPWQFRTESRNFLKKSQRLGDYRMTDYSEISVGNVKVHASQSSRSKVLGRLREGEKVRVIDSRGNWWLVDPEGRVAIGYVSSRNLSSIQSSSLVVVGGSTGASQRSDAEVVKEIIEGSISNFRGNCPCPYSKDRAGRRCNARSAYSRPGGEVPICFESDIPAGLLRARGMVSD